jgi:VanZ family protein
VNGATILRALFGIATLVIGAVVIYYAMIFEGPFPDHPALRGKNDLALHVAAFFALSTPLLLLGSWRRKVMALILFAGLIEIVQVFQPLRSADWVDFAGSVAGIAVAALIVMGVRGARSLVAPKKEQIDE